MTWNVATPADTESIRQGASRIRELKNDLVTALSTEGIFPGPVPGAPVFRWAPRTGGTAARPANDPVNPGTLYVNTDTGSIQQDNGTTWNDISGFPNGLTNPIQSSMIAPGAIITALIAAQAVVAANIANGTITAAQIAAATILEANLAPLSVGTPELIAGAVTSAKIAAATIQESNMAPSSVGTAELIANSVTEAKLANASVGTPELITASVTSSKLASGILHVPKTNVSSLIIASSVNGSFGSVFSIPSGSGALKGISLKAFRSGGASGTSSFTIRITLDGVQYTVAGLTSANTQLYAITANAWTNAAPPTLANYFQANGGAALGTGSDFYFGFTSSLLIELEANSFSDGNNGFYVATSYEN